MNGRLLAGLLVLLTTVAQAQTAPVVRDTVLSPGPARNPAPAKNTQRPGSATTPPVRYISPDPRDPVGPPPPGATNPGQARIPAPSHKPVPDTVAPGTKREIEVADAGDTLTLKAGRKGQIESTVKYAAKDSIQFDVSTKTARLYNKANVDYGDMNMKAALITVNYGQNLVMAEGRMDTVKHRLEGRPVVKDASGLYTAGKIAYNTKTKKGRIEDVVTQQGEGYVHAETLKKQPDNSFYGRNGQYTTCNLEHPHFYFLATKMKMTEKSVITGPFNLVIGGVPTPLGFLFGYFPKTKGGRGSGILIPTFGQAADRGYFLTNGGYYFAPNDNIGVRLTGDIYAGNAQSFGGWGATADIQYLKRYAYNGTFNFRFSDRPQSQILAPTGLSTSPEYIKPPSAQTFWLSWSHTPIPKPGGGRFSASVQAGSSSYNRTNSLDSRRFLAPAFSSSISYSKQIRNSPVNYSVKLSQDQNTPNRSDELHAARREPGRGPAVPVPMAGSGAGWPVLRAVCHQLQWHCPEPGEQRGGRPRPGRAAGAGRHQHQQPAAAHVFAPGSRAGQCPERHSAHVGHFAGLLQYCEKFQALAECELFGGVV